MFTSGATPSSLSSAGARSSPPKYGQQGDAGESAMRMGPAAVAVQLWWVRMPPTLSAARKQREGLTEMPRTGEAGVPEVPEYVHDMEARKPIQTQLVVRRSGGVSRAVLAARWSAGRSAL
jgi:hypothetical protein